MPRTLLASMTYRTFEADWVGGAVQTLVRNAELQERLDRLGMDVSLEIARGYGGGRNAGGLIEMALDLGYDLILFAEQDIRFEGRHVAQILEAHHYLTVRDGAAPVVASMYPMSSDPRVQLLAARPGENKVDLRDRVSRERLRTAVQYAQTVRDNPNVNERYVEVWMVPFGFAVFPVGLFRQAPPLAEMGGFRTQFCGFDEQVSLFLRNLGHRMYVDLASDVGHLSARPISTLEQLETEADHG